MVILREVDYRRLPSIEQDVRIACSSREYTSAAEMIDPAQTALPCSFFRGEDARNTIGARVLFVNSRKTGDGQALAKVEGN
jgi:hypothetical protein